MAVRVGERAESWVAEHPDHVTAFLEEAKDLVFRSREISAPRSDAEVRNGFAEWLSRARSVLAPALSELWRREPARPEAIWEVVEIDAWPILSDHLLRFRAVKPVAARWALTRIGDAIILGVPERRSSSWHVPLGLRSAEGFVGRIVVSDDGTVDEQRTTTRQQLIDLTHG
jgi:hypothetical protein